MIIIQVLLFLAFAACIAGTVISFLNGRVSAGILGIVGVIVFAAGVVISMSFVQVDAGNVGVVKVGGQVQQGTLDPGLHVIWPPFITEIVQVDTRVQPHQFQEIDAASKEYQTVKLTGTMNYHVDARYASDLYQRVGTDFAPKVIDPAFNDFIKTVVPNYTADQSRPDNILAHRDDIRAQAKEALSANLAQYHIIIDDIYIANVSFSPEYQAAIESKQVAQQQVATEQQILAQKSIQAQQRVAEAQGVADASVVSAKGQAQANDLLTKSLTPELIQYTLIQKLAPTIQTMILPSGQNFILDPSALLPKAK